MGRTTFAAAFFRLKHGSGRRSGSGNVFGTYVHGIFEQGTTRAFVNCMLRSMGLTEATGAVDWAQYKQQQYDALAQGVRQALDMPYVYRLLDLDPGAAR